MIAVGDTAVGRGVATLCARYAAVIMCAVLVVQVAILGGAQIGGDGVQAQGGSHALTVVLAQYGGVTVESHGQVGNGEAEIGEGSLGLDKDVTDGGQLPTPYGTIAQGAATGGGEPYDHEDVHGND